MWRTCAQKGCRRPPRLPPHRDSALGPLVTGGAASGCRADPRASHESPAAVLRSGALGAQTKVVHAGAQLSGQASPLKGCLVEALTKNLGMSSREAAEGSYMESGIGRPWAAPPTRVSYRKAQDGFSPWPVRPRIRALVG